MQCDHITKKHLKQLQKYLREEDFIMKVPEKIRCVYHFAQEETADTLDIQTIIKSQVLFCLLLRFSYSSEQN